VNVLTKIERRKKRQKLRGESVCRIIEMNVEVTGDHKFMGSACSVSETFRRPWMPVRRNVPRRLVRGTGLLNDT